jgi:dihydroorotate dehydrogenase (fumarate)
MLSLKTKYASNPLINASGCMCATTKMLDELNTGTSGAIITKSATQNPRAGNPEPRYWESPYGTVGSKNLLHPNTTPEVSLSSDNLRLSGTYTINSMGLPNCGFKYYLDYYKNMTPNGKSRFVSIAGLSLEENKALVDLIFDCPDEPYYRYIDAIEINPSCPNLIGHRQLAYDFAEFESYLSVLIPYIQEKRVRVLTEQSHAIWLGLKLPPYFEFCDFDRVTELLKPYNHIIQFVHCINSVPNGLVIDAETEAPVIVPKQGFGGLGGSIIKPIALANVRAFYVRFRDAGLDIDIIGSGGVSNGTDVFEFILAGAEMVSVGSQLMVEGVSCFEYILAELEQIMAIKGYGTLDDFRGKLKC